MNNMHPVVSFLQDIGVKMNDEQQAAVIAGLRIKKKGKSASFKAKQDEAPADMKLPRQALICFQALTKLTEPVDLEAWGAAAIAEGLQTKQLPERICGYYKQTLLDADLIEQVTEA